MNIDDISKDHTQFERSFSKESFSELHTILDDNDNQYMNMSSPDSNYVSGSSMVCSESSREPIIDMNFTILNMCTDIKTDISEDLYDFSNMITTGEIWLYESLDNSHYGQSCISILTSFIDSIVKDENDLLSLLTKYISVSELSDTSTISTDLNRSPRGAPCILNATSTPIASKQYRTAYTNVNGTFNLDKCDSKSDVTVSIDRNFTKLVSPIKYLTDSSEENVNCQLIDQTFLKNDVEKVSEHIASNVVSRPISSLNPQKRLSMTNVRTLKQPETKPYESKPVLITNKANNDPVKISLNRQSVIIRPNSNLAALSKLHRQSIAVIPQSSNKDAPRTIVAPQTTLQRTFALPSKMPPPGSVPRNTSNRPPLAPLSKIAKVNSLSKDVAPSVGIRRPTQLKARNNNALPAVPLLSDTTPVMSPSSNLDDNPLSRTFDKSDFQLLKSDFQLLKSVTNTESHDTAHSTQSSTDSLNNNCRTIYALAQAEEVSLKTDLAAPARPRGLRPPSKVQSRAIPSLKK